MKWCWLDVETTGVDETKHGIIQIAGLIIDEKSGKELASFNYPVKPFKGQMISQEALTVTGKTIEQLREFPEPREVYTLLNDTFTGIVDKYDRTDKMFFAAYNAVFDWRFMWKFWENCGDKYFGSLFWYPPIDIAVLAGAFLTDKRHTMKNFKLETVAETLGIEFDKDKTHDAFFDIMLTIQIFKKIKGEPK